MRHGPTHGGRAGAGEAQGQRRLIRDGWGGPSQPQGPTPCDTLRLLAAIIAGARPPAIAGPVATLATRVAFGVVDALTSFVADLGPAETTPDRADASGAWSGVLLPMQREAARLLPMVFDGIRDAVATPDGDCRLTITITVAAHDRLALWGAGLDLVVHLIERPAPVPVLPLTALEPGVSQEMAALVLGLYATQERRAPEAPEAPGQVSAA